MWGELKFGTVVHYKNFPFENGITSDKLLIVLGARTDTSRIIALTTSKEPSPQIQPGCTPKRSLFRCQKNKHDCFHCDTYVQLYRLGEIAPKHLNEHWTENAQIIGQLSDQTANAIKNCAIASHDVSARHKALLGSPPPAKKAEL